MMRKPRRTSLHPKGEIKIIEAPPLLMPGVEVTLASLVGFHVLDAVDFFTEQTKSPFGEMEDCEQIIFRLDGISYVAVEDPDDGYRSMLRYILVTDNPMKNIFPPIRVSAIRKIGRDHDDDILQFFDVETNKIVLEVGTENTSDYYPSFISNFRPENMTINAIKPIIKPTRKRKIKVPGK